MSLPFNRDFGPMDHEVHHISTSRPIAKKEYTCSCCKKPIKKGSKHYKNVFKVGTDKKIRWERAHINCPEW